MAETVTLTPVDHDPFDVKTTPVDHDPFVDWSKYNQPTGEAKTATYTPTQRIGNTAADLLMAGGMQPYTAADLTSRVGNVINMSPLGVAGSALDTIAAQAQGDKGGVIQGMAGMIPGAGPEAKAAWSALRQERMDLRAAERKLMEAMRTPAEKHVDPFAGMNDKQTAEAFEKMLRGGDPATQPDSWLAELLKRVNHETPLREQVDAKRQTARNPHDEALFEYLTNMIDKIEPEKIAEKPQQTQSLESELSRLFAPKPVESSIIPHRAALPAFVSEVTRYHDALPSSVRDVLQTGRSNIHVGEKLTDTNPDLVGVQPRGWPKGYTWDNVEGLQRNGQVHVARTSLDRFTGKYEPSYRVEGVHNHEVGHAFDYHLGDDGYISRGKDFTVAYDADLQNLTAEDRRGLEYFLQPGDAGRQEAFAEVFAQLIGKGSMSKPIVGYFPNVAKFIMERIK